jgi:hypothetical protein
LIVVRLALDCVKVRVFTNAAVSVSRAIAM